MVGPRRSTVIDDMIDVLRAVLAERSGVYVSAPITSGKRLFDLQAGLRTHGPIDAATLARDVIAPNVADTVALVRAARGRFGYTVIDPSPLVMPDWTQQHYIALWGAVVARYARLVVFSDGWELSSGCTYEFVVACNGNIPAVDARFDPLSRERGVALIADAKAALEARDVPVPYLGERLEQLRQLRLSGEPIVDDELDSNDRSASCSRMLGTVAPPRTAVVVCSAGAGHGTRIGELRGHGKLVIDTSAFAPSSWSSGELRDLWFRAAQSYAAEVVVADDWPHNENCIAAYYAAAKAGITITRPNGDAISPVDATESIEAAVSKLHESNGSADMRKLLLEIKELHHVQ